MFILMINHLKVNEIFLIKRIGGQSFRKQPPQSPREYRQ